jgi:iron complex transport system substrate-binding protein
MKRVLTLAAILLLAGVAFYTRFNRMAKPPSSAAPLSTSRPDDMPHDYVSQPVVDPSERQAGPQRIISIAPSVTELSAALGLADRLVGRTQFCRYPPSVQNAAVVGGYADPNLEKIVALKPDLVLITTSSNRLRDQLDGLNLSIKELPDSSLDDIFEAIRLLGQYVRRPRTAAALAGELEADLERLASKKATPRPRVLILVGAMPASPRSVYVAGPGSFLDRIVELAGGRNALAELLNRPWGEVSAETVIAAKPDAIIETRTDSNPERLEQVYHGWSDFDWIPAIGRRRICSIDDDSILVPGPRVNITLYRVIQALKPVLGAD